MNNRTKNIIDTFDKWAIGGKDKGMEQGHFPSVMHMIDIVKSEKNISKNSFSALDLGCGNGWMAREIKSIANCNNVLGIDGSKSMIDNAKNIDPDGEYITGNINEWVPENKFNLVMSMEVFYYLEKPRELISKIYSQFLHSPGMLVIGIDHYKENIPSLTWPGDLNLELRTYSEKHWKDMLIDSGFKKVNSKTTPSNGDWNGTLILTGVKG